MKRIALAGGIVVVAIVAVAATELLGAFHRHRIVALGLSHGLRQQEDFVIGLLRHPRFAATVDSIAVEFGNARFQALADRYVAGGDVSAKALRPVWRDTIGTAPDGGPDEAFAQFFAAVRRLNQTLPAGRRIRVALGDPAFEAAAASTLTRNVGPWCRSRARAARDPARFPSTRPTSRQPRSQRRSHSGRTRLDNSDLAASAADTSAWPTGAPAGHG